MFTSEAGENISGDLSSVEILVVGNLEVKETSLSNSIDEGELAPLLEALELLESSLESSTLLED